MDMKTLIRAMSGAYLPKKVLTNVWLPSCVCFIGSELYINFTLFTADSYFWFVGKVKSTQCYFRFNAIDNGDEVVLLVYK